MLGVMMAEEMVNEHFKETNPQKVKLLEHIIASHHGTPEFWRGCLSQSANRFKPCDTNAFLDFENRHNIKILTPSPFQSQQKMRQWKKEEVNSNRFCGVKNGPPTLRICAAYGDRLFGV